MVVKTKTKKTFDFFRPSSLIIEFRSLYSYHACILTFSKVVVARSCAPVTKKKRCLRREERLPLWWAIIHRPERAYNLFRRASRRRTMVRRRKTAHSWASTSALLLPRAIRAILCHTIQWGVQQREFARQPGMATRLRSICVLLFDFKLGSENIARLTSSITRHHHSTLRWRVRRRSCIWEQHRTVSRCDSLYFLS